MAPRYAAKVEGKLERSPASSDVAVPRCKTDACRTEIVRVRTISARASMQ